MHVEITRALTAKSGSVEVTAFLHEQDAKEKGKYIDTVVGSTKIQVVCTHCNEKGEK